VGTNSAWPRGGALGGRGSAASDLARACRAAQFISVSALPIVPYREPPTNQLHARTADLITSLSAAPPNTSDAMSLSVSHSTRRPATRHSRFATARPAACDRARLSVSRPVSVAWIHPPGSYYTICRERLLLCRNRAQAVPARQPSDSTDAGSCLAASICAEFGRHRQTPR